MYCTVAVTVCTGIVDCTWAGITITGVAVGGLAGAGHVVQVEGDVHAVPQLVAVTVEVGWQFEVELCVAGAGAAGA